VKGEGTNGVFGGEPPGGKGPPLVRMGDQKVVKKLPVTEIANKVGGPVQEWGGRAKKGLLRQIRGDVE